MNHNVAWQTIRRKGGRRNVIKTEKKTKFIQKNRHLFSCLLNFRCFVVHDIWNFIMCISIESDVIHCRCRCRHHHHHQRCRYHSPPRISMPMTVLRLSVVIPLHKFATEFISCWIGMKLNGSTDNWNNEDKLMENSCIEEMHNFREKWTLTPEMYDRIKMRVGGGGRNAKIGKQKTLKMRWNSMNQFC